MTALDLAPVREATTRRAWTLDPDAVRDIAPIVASAVPFAAIIGVVVSQSLTVPIWAGLLAGPLMYAGSSLLAALTMIDGGVGAAAVIGTVVVINARLSMYGAAIEPFFRHQPAWFRWLAPHFLVDQTYVIATARDDLADPARFRRYWTSVGIVLGVGWTAAMAVAVLLGPIVPPDSPLSFASTAVFIALLVPRLRERIARRPALIGAVVAVLASPLPHGLGVIAGLFAGVIPSLLTDRSEA